VRFSGYGKKPQQSRKPTATGEHEGDNKGNNYFSFFLWISGISFT
jgi:hypothetical protein